jgi:hypothetical protein
MGSTFVYIVSSSLQGVLGKVLGRTQKAAPRQVLQVRTNDPPGLPVENEEKSSSKQPFEDDTFDSNPAEVSLAVTFLQLTDSYINTE